MASTFFVAAKRSFIRREYSSSFMNYRSQFHIFNSTSSSINPPPLRHRLIDVEFMQSPYKEDKEREWERRMDSINAGIAEVHKLNYSLEATAELEKLIRQVEDEKAARNKCRTDWKLGYDDRRQRVNHLYNELRKMDASWAEYRAKLDEILLAGKETESDESIDNGPAGFAKGSSALAKHLDKPNQETTHLVEVIARTEEAMVIARPEEEEEEEDYLKVKIKLAEQILELIFITTMGVSLLGLIFLMLLLLIHITKSM